MAEFAAHVTSSNAVIQGLVDTFAAELEAHLDGDVLSYQGPMYQPVDEMIRDALEARQSKRSKLLFVLQTEGGYIEAVVRIVDTLRHHYSSVEFIIPNYAFSAGTVLALSGDEIYMDYFSVLGPTDPQNETADGVVVPGLHYIERYEQLIEKARRGTITSAEITLLVSGFDLGRLQMYVHSIELSKQLIKDWLPKYKFKNWTTTATSGKRVTARMRTTRAVQIANKLSDTKKWHSHGYGIGMEILRRDIGLEIKDFGSDAELNRCIKQFNGLLSDFTNRLGASVVLYTPGRLVIPGRQKI